MTFKPLRFDSKTSLRDKKKIVHCTNWTIKCLHSKKKRYPLVLIAKHLGENTEKKILEQQKSQQHLLLPPDDNCIVADPARSRVPPPVDESSLSNEFGL